jgi:hypothetical protein
MHVNLTTASSPTFGAGFVPSYFSCLRGTAEAIEPGVAALEAPCSGNGRVNVQVDEMEMPGR